MRAPATFLLALLVAPLLAGPDPALADAAGTPRFHPYGYFEVRQDLRRCVSPLCGGVWVRRLNAQMTRCADGAMQRECYLAELRDAPADLLATRAQVIIRGRLLAREYEGFGNLGEFAVSGAWRAATEALPGRKESRQVHYSGIEESGIVCITTPCESLGEYVLNSPRQRLLTDIDLSRVGADPALEEEALALIGGDGVVLMRGITRQLESNPGRVFEARQFYLPVP